MGDDVTVHVGAHSLSEFRKIIGEIITVNEYFSRVGNTFDVIGKNI